MTARQPGVMLPLVVATAEEVFALIATVDPASISPGPVTCTCPWAESPPPMAQWPNSTALLIVQHTELCERAGVLTPVGVAVVPGHLSDDAYADGGRW